jgi:hypothetical protein
MGCMNSAEEWAAKTVPKFVVLAEKVSQVILNS